MSQYVTFMRGLLDITDNLVDGEVVHPERVRVLDGDDSYLVVAADKGTATFSDTANGVAARVRLLARRRVRVRRSAGFDHKALGITARGAWESVKRHFRELGDRRRCSSRSRWSGIGDMSGDVFGNGMLLSDRHAARRGVRPPPRIPGPRPRAGRGSFDERKRLFELPGSSWNDYDRSMLSARRRRDRSPGEERDPIT